MNFIETNHKQPISLARTDDQIEKKKTVCLIEEDETEYTERTRQEDGIWKVSSNLYVMCNTI